MALSAVITADIVNSTRLSRVNLKAVMKAITTVFAGQKIEFFRGDSFQVYVKSPAEALPLLLQARSVTLKMSNGISDIKACVGIDQVSLPVKELSTAAGEAFILSGRAFDDMKTNKRLLMISGEKNSTVNTGLRLLGVFVDYLYEHMTPKQAVVVFEMLSGKTQTDTARKLKKSQATVHKHLQSAGWPEIENLLKEYQLLINVIKS
ncbi:MAG: helix-turn-helix transcriptional regulator [Flavisolibacter sp.]